MGSRIRSIVGFSILLACGVGALSPFASAQKPLRWRDVRGTNYVPASSVSDNNIQMWLPRAAGQGMFDARLVEDELSAVSSYGINSIRVFGSFYAFVANPEGYARNLRALLDACRGHGLRVTFVVWDTFGRDGLHATFLSAAAPAGVAILKDVWRARRSQRRQNPSMPADMGGFWFASPGRAYHAAHPSPDSWHPKLQAQADRYLDRLARFFGGTHADVFHAYDLYNEPENLLLVPGMTQRHLVRISTDLCQYSLARLGRHQPNLAATCGAAFIDTCRDIDTELRRRGLPPLDYFSYHDYGDPGGALSRATLARYYGRVAGRDVVCSEFHQAARQGGLWPLLHALHHVKVGGQIWDFLRDRVFVTEFPELAAVMGGRDRCWFHESGVIRPEPDARRAGGFRFVPIDPVKSAAFSIWALNGAVPAFVSPEVRVTRTASSGSSRYRVTVTGLAGQPAWLLICPTGAARMRLPGLGSAIIESRTRVAPLGALLRIGPTAAGAWTDAFTLPARTHIDVEVQALVGGDYDPRHWWQSRVCALSRALRVRL